MPAKFFTPKVHSFQSLNSNQHIFTLVDRVQLFLHAIDLPHRTWFHRVWRHQVVATARRCWCRWFCGWPRGRGHLGAGRGIWLVSSMLWAGLSWADYTVWVYLGCRPWYICCTYTHTENETYKIRWLSILLTYDSLRQSIPPLRELTPTFSNQT